MIDPLEKEFESICNQNNIRFKRPEQEKNNKTLDFFLVDYNVYVEVKAYSCERMHHQIVRNGNPPIIVIIGIEAVKSFGAILQSFKKGV